MNIIPLRFKNKVYNNIVDEFTMFINYNICSMSPLKYNPPDLKDDGSLFINIKNDKIFNISAIDTILDLFKNLDFNKQKLRIKFLYRTISKFTDINELYTITEVFTKRFAKLVFNKFKYKEPKQITKTFKDGSNINIIIDPYFNDYGIFCDYSKKLSDFDYGYNYLHVFEHIMCLPWKNAEKTHNVIMNGFTSLVGVSIIYTIDNEEEIFKDKLKDCIKHHYECRSDSYWNAHKDDLLLEIRRTYSETFDSKSFHDYFRTSPDVFDTDTTILKYFASCPINMLIVSPNEFDFNFDIVNKYASKYKPITVKPKVITFDYIPLEVISSKRKAKYRIEKTTKEEIDKVINGDNVNYWIGLDSKYSYNNMSMNNPLLIPLLVIRQKNLLEYIIPQSVKLIKDFPIVKIVKDSN